MIVPSIDLMNGRAVQLVGGERLEIDAGDPFPIAERFSLAGELAVIDLDAALGKGDNGAIIRELVRRYPCRVGGGIRSADAALRWLDAGAEKVILGTAATPEILGELPRDRTIAALDARDGEVVVEGWKTRTGRGIIERIEELRPFVGGFLVTLVENEGRLTGLDEPRVREIADACERGGAKLTIAGGVRNAADVALADRLGADAQVGMAIYSGRLDLADAIGACLRSDRADGLWPTVVCDERGVCLGLVYSSAESLREAFRTRRGVYWSRSRNDLWRKGESSGATQELLRIDADCDRDALRFTVRQHAGFCHTGSRGCFGEDDGIGRLARRLAERIIEPEPGSYTQKLIERPELLKAKLLEEAGELADTEGPEHAAAEAADLLYFALVKAIASGASLGSIERELNLREKRVQRRSQTKGEKSAAE
ncbi:MAG: phosphoribosyl-ATP diphosphatase [Phycisphaerales bacterium]|nr:MAG: phosphoribosyl-ATP diphosphatase [Phycisphaerales bacterium]